ncbi:MAG: hypothetical protein IPM31_03330 [Anaerolineae bacterium]|nr:hypothetical protein [Anaerolineae bacterium]
MNSSKTAMVIRVLAGAIFSFSLILSSCQFPGASELTGITPTQTIPSPTPRICPDVSLENLDQLELTPSFIVVLFDPNTTDAATLEYLSGDKTGDALDYIGNVLPKILGTGSQFSIFSLGFRSYEAAKLDRYSSKITNAPELVATPRPYTTLTAVPTPTTSDAVLQHQEAKNQYNATSTAHFATATQLAFEDLCHKTSYDDQYKATATQWSITQQAEAAEIATQVESARLERETKVAVLETPFAPNNVYEGLSHVTIDFENQCKNYDRCILLIFDNLTDWRGETPDYLHINLENVEVISVLAQCEDIIQPSCKEIQDKWTPLFESYGVKSVEYLNGERLEAFLLNYFGGK